jgi:hypothetical protein
MKLTAAASRAPLERASEWCEYRQLNCNGVHFAFCNLLGAVVGERFRTRHFCSVKYPLFAAALWSSDITVRDAGGLVLLYAQL